MQMTQATPVQSSWARPELRAAAFALLPMAFAAVGAWVDQRSHQGFSAWRSACRAAGIRLESMLVFTIDLLPAASIGLFIGAMTLQFIAAVVWHRPGGARTALAAHAGCALGMLAGLALCALLPSLPLMFGAEVLVAAGSAMILCRGTSAKPRTSVRQHAYQGVYRPATPLPKIS